MSFDVAAPVDVDLPEFLNCWFEQNTLGDYFPEQPIL
jgi:hypothetical protein